MRALWLIFLAIFWSFISPDTSPAQVSTDGTAGAERVLTGPDYSIDAELGTQAGGNLFHSFQQFSIGTGESATFSGPGSIENIISRVTGGDISSIDGLLAATIPGASLFLFNPAGVVFGPNASLDVTGSFHVSTADELRLEDGGTFSASAPESNGFSVAAPESFGFLGADPAGIAIAGSQLSVNDGETLSVVGGDVDIAGANLAVGSGSLNVLAAGGAVDANVVTGDLTGTTDGAITVRADAALSSTGDGGGGIRIEGGEFVVEENSSIASTNTGATDGNVGIDIDVQTAEITDSSLVISDAQADGKGGDIDLKADDLLVSGSGIASNSSAAGDGGAIDITGGNVAFRDDGFTLSLAQGSGDGGSIDMTADDLTLANGDIVADTADTASGNGGDITIATDSLELRAGGLDERSSIVTSSFGSGAAGDIDIRSGRVLADGGSQLLGASIQTIDEGNESSGGQIRLVVGSLDLVNGGVVFGESSGGSTDASSIDVTADTVRIDGSIGTVTGINLDVDGQTAAAPDGIVIRVGELDISDGGQIDSGTVGISDAGDISIIADSISLSSEGPGISSNISSDSSVGASGNAGRITIVADVIDLSGDATIRSAAFGDGDAGVIDIRTDTSLELRNDSSINTSTFSTEIGAAGSIVIDTAELTILDAGRIISATFGSGDAGSIDVTADTALFDARGADQLSGISTQADTGTSGDAGDITLAIDDLTIRNTTEVSSTAFGSGDAGTISVRSDEILIDGRQGDPRFLTGISSAVATGGVGEAGAIVIIADQLVLKGETADITSSNDGEGPAGTIDIELTDSLVVERGADIATRSASAGGGRVTIGAGSSILIAGPGSEITTTVADDTGDAGDIVIDTPLLALGDADILARADAGRGGDIQITADDLLLSPEALISAEAGVAGIDGTVAVSAPEIDLTGGLAALDGAFLDISSLLRERCAVRRDAGGSSFTLGTGGSLPADLDAPQLSLLETGSDRTSSGYGNRRTIEVIPCPTPSP